MLLDFADLQIRTRIVRIAPGKARLTLDYPTVYRDRVMTALSDLLRPTQSEPTPTEANNAPSADAERTVGSDE